MGRTSLCRREGASKTKNDTDEGWRCRAEPAPRRGDNAKERVHFCGNGAPASNSWETPRDGSKGVVRVRRRPKWGRWIRRYDKGAPASKVGGDGSDDMIKVHRRPKWGMGPRVAIRRVESPGE
ncbi:hypothetical protein Y032_0105g3677 [Ancylostoma ceylanicum]|uniref:Uncharacterized protein n=1 Tax=Ancylostoma ceylanicum TaxID=53326 RepID=A0A016TFE3_9BILA|nr:hypothetical protein Y032_0105g3677 [Ancylostoma ceylanicum]